MGVRTSYSQSSTFKDCSQHWYWRYKEKLEGEDSGASTFFGSAVDSAVMHLLEGGLHTFKDEFSKLWYCQKDRKKNDVMIYDNENIIFGYSDFDKDVLREADIETLGEQVKELQLEQLGKDPIEVYKAVAKIKKNPYKKIRTNELKYFNRASWLSMHQKGLILLDSFYEQFYPKIEKVLTTQKFALLKDQETGDIIQGVIDMVLKLKGYEKPIIFDLKTASKSYTQEQIDFSDQLTLYAAMEGHKYNTDQVGYVVLSKNINKEKESYCGSCGHKKQGKHRTCNNQVTKDGATVRCNGEWQDKVLLKPKVQILIQSKSEKEIQRVLDEQINIITAMKNNTIFKNTSKCTSWYGGICPYKKLCWEGDATGLNKRD